MDKTDLKDVFEKYEKMFDEPPPIFGYAEEDILPAIKKALKTY